MYYVYGAGGAVRPSHPRSGQVLQVQHNPFTLADVRWLSAGDALRLRGPGA